MKLNLTLNEISKIIGGRIIGDQTIIINRIYTDSRKNLSIQNSLFAAISGTYNNGHDYISNAFSQGINAFIVEDTKHLPENANAIEVSNTLAAIQKLATWHRKNFSIPVIGITGSYGKTIVKEWLYHCLSDNYNIVRSPKSYNSQIGVPLSVLEIGEEHTLGIFEAGISMKGEMKTLSEIIQPTITVLTSIGDAHIENFEDQNEIQKEKAFLEKGAETKIHFTPLSEIDYNQTKEGVELKWENNKYHIPFLDNGSIQNALTVIKVLLALEIDQEHIYSKLKELPTIALRLETKIGANNSIIINDSDNTDINALTIALDYLNKVDKNKKKSVILSDIFLDKTTSEDAYNRIKNVLNQYEIDELIGIGLEFEKQQVLFKNASVFKSTEEFIYNIHQFDFSNNIILLKGGDKFNFNSISEILELKSHQTVLNINLNRLLHNVNQYKALLKPSTKLLCMIKAFGYGNGIKEIANFLNHHGAEYFGVAYTDEGVFLRNENIETPIIVMNPEITSFKDIIRYKLEPSIYNIKQLDSFIRHCIDYKVSEFPIHIKIDTGMNRLGFKPEDIPQLVALLKAQPEVSVKSIFSHLAATDERKKDNFTNQQIQLFKQSGNELSEALGYNPMLHILNSNGIENFPDSQFEMVRLGIGMYGVTKSKLKLQPVSSLTTVVVDIKNAKKGESVGYGCTPLKKDTKIAILPIGYADGYNRKLSNGLGSVYINGKKAQTIGKISMDMLAIEVTGLDCKEGDTVELFGDHIPIQELAKNLDTIPYEIMTSISSRVSRIYIEE